MEVIFYLDLGESDNNDTVPPATISDYLSYLNLPPCKTLEQGWDILRAVLEEWQRPFFLVIDITAGV